MTLSSELGKGYPISKETEAMKRSRDAADAGAKSSQTFMSQSDRLNVVEDKIDRILSILNNKGE